MKNIYRAFFWVGYRKPRQIIVLKLFAEKRKINV